MLFDEAKALSLSKRVLPKFEQGNINHLLPEHPHLYDPPLQVLEFRDTVVSRDGFLQFPSGEIITDLGYQRFLERGQEHLRFARENPSAIQTIEEPIILIGGHNNYYHWHLNWMPRIFLADRFADLRDKRLLIHAQPSRFVLESLQAVTGRTASDLRHLTGQAIRLKHVFVPTMFLNPMHAPFALRGYNSLRRMGAAPAERRLYISRKKAPVRRILNEDALTSMLEEYGFETIHAEDLSYTQQIKLFSEASFIIGAHGAGLTNLLFCNPGFRTIELSNAYFTRVYWSLSLAMGGETYDFLRSKKAVATASDRNLETVKDSDFSVDLENVQKILDEQIKKHSPPQSSHLG